MIQSLVQLSFTGMRDSLDPSTADPRRALLLANVYPVDTHLGAAVVGRPGFQTMGAQGGSGGARRVQKIYQFTKLNGTEYTVRFVGGKMYTFDWALRTWSEVALVGVSLSTTEKVRCVTFANTLVVSDGVNRPWTWDGTTFTDLTNAPVAYGAPTVYYAKLFFIKNTERNTIVWSEEADATTGYEASGFNNAWTLGQTDQEAIVAIQGTNEALYYWRARSAGAISGAVNADFVNSGTRENVSNNIGTASPDGIVIHEQAIYFLSADGYPYKLQIGGSLVPLWADVRETLSGFPRDSLSKVVTANYLPTQHVVIGIPESGATYSSRYLAIDTRTDLIGGLWSGFTSAALDVVKDEDGIPVMCHGSENGYTYDHGNPDGILWQDENHADDGGTLPIQHTVTGTPMGYELDGEKTFDRIDLTMRMLTDMTSCQLDYETPNGTSTAQSVSFESNFAQWDVAEWDDDSWSAIALERHFAVGWNGQGRWNRPRLRHAFGTERFGLIGWKVTAIPDAPEPAAL